MTPYDQAVYWQQLMPIVQAKNIPIHDLENDPKWAEARNIVKGRMTLQEVEDATIYELIALIIHEYGDNNNPSEVLH